MPYILYYHHKVQEDDLSAISASIRKRISEAIESRLLTEPEKYGHPLRKPLSGYWKLRVGDYRIVYKILKDDLGINDYTSGQGI